MDSNHELKKKHSLDLDALLADNVESKVVDDEKTKSPKQTQSSKLLEIISASGANFFHTDRNEPFVSIPINGHCETYGLGGKAFRSWLAGQYYTEVGKPIGNNAINEAIEVMSFTALFCEDKEVVLHTRVAGTSEAVYYDLADRDWNVVQVVPGNWMVSNKISPLFRRFSHQVAQVMPTPGGDVRNMLDFVSIKKHKFLFLCWLIASFIPGVPHPLLTIYGEKGSAKTSSCEFFKSVVDPSLLKTLTLSKDSRNLLVNLLEHWLAPFDNVSYLDEEVSDFLCRVITGGGVQNRVLYSDSDSVTYSLQRGVVLNGISNVATRPDLLDRSILMELERISEDERKELAEVQTEFEAAKSSILGGIFDTLAAAMAIYPSVKLKKLPRMADFAKWGFAIGEALEEGGKQIGKSVHDKSSALKQSIAVPRVNLSNTQDVQERTFLYLDACEIAQSFPSVMGLSGAMGCSRQNVNQWLLTHPGHPTTDFISMVKDVMADVLTNASLCNNSNPVMTIFTLKNHFEHADRVEITPVVQNLFGCDEYSADEIRKRYLMSENDEPKK